MSSFSSNILDWLSEVQTQTTHLGRKRSYHSRRLTPSTMVAGQGDDVWDEDSEDELATGPVTPKRPRVTSYHGTPVKKTPQPVVHSRASSLSRMPSSDYLRGSSSGYSRGRGSSGRSTPRKKLLALSFEPEGIESRTLRRTQQGIPVKLVRMLGKMEKAAHGEGFISSAHKVYISLIPLLSHVISHPQPNHTLRKRYVAKSSEAVP